MQEGKDAHLRPQSQPTALTCLSDSRLREKCTEVPAEKLHMARQPALT